MPSYSISVDVAGAASLSDTIGRFSRDVLDGVAVRSVNAVADRTRTAAVKAIISKVNLTESYVDDKLDLRKAESVVRNTASAVISTPMASTIITRYDGRQVVSKVNWPNASFRAGKWGRNPKKAGSFLKWKARTGDQMRGIPVDMKAAGLAVQVTRGRNKTLPKTFVIVMGGKSIPFVHHGKNIEPVYGPAVYQVFTSYSKDNENQISDDLNREVSEQIDIEIRKFNE